MVTPTTVTMIRDIVTIFGVIAGFSYYFMTVRMNQRAMRINLTNNLIQQISTDEFIIKVSELMYMEWDDYDDFERKYGSDVNFENYIKRNSVWGAYDSLGNLLRIGMADKDIIFNSMYAFNALPLWYKYEDVLNMNRKLYSGSDTWRGFEFLADELEKTRMARDPDWDYKSYSLEYDEARKQKANR